MANVKLPLDNFQILGASPASNTRNILIMLERKLERCEYPDFTKETLNKRIELLNEFSKPLLDNEKRKDLERMFNIVNSVDEESRFLSVANGYEVAGLLLLLETKQSEECLGLAVNQLEHNKKYHASNSHELVDLYRLISYATLEHARELKQKRYYEYSARVLEYGLEELKNISELDAVKALIKNELDDLTPYRILDLLSKNTDEPMRELGIKLLKEFVSLRGGLDGGEYLYMEDNEFKAFFRQIRYFLTLQEQIDLYQEWCQNGSNSACFLLGISLVACGFARRKPEKLVKALEVMKRLGTDELETYITYIDLLLGRVNTNKKILQTTNQSISHDTPNEPKTHEAPDAPDAASETNLAELCLNCRDWLDKDVLDGYRDLEADSDLEAYFSDRDVTSFIEKNDRIPQSEVTQKNFFGSSDFSNNLLNKLPTPKFFERHHSDKIKTNDVNINSSGKLHNKLIVAQLGRKKWILGSIFLTLVAGFVVFAGNHANRRPKDDTITTKKLPLRQHTTNLNQGFNRNNVQANIADKTKHVDVPSASIESKLASIISDWLVIKAQTLSGSKSSKDINSIATPGAIERLKAERNEDKQNGETQEISAKIIDLKIVDQQSNQIQVDATISYSDLRLNKEKKVIEKTPAHVLKRRYTLVNRDSAWKLQ